MIRGKLVELNNKKEHIKNQIDDIIKNGKGKKMFVTYFSNKYYIPKNQQGKFITLKTELNKLNNYEPLNQEILELKAKAKTLTDEEIVKNQIDIMTNSEIIDALTAMPTTEEEMCILISAGILAFQTNVISPEEKKLTFNTKKDITTKENEIEKSICSEEHSKPLENKNTYKILKVRKPKLREKIKKILIRTGLITGAIISTTVGIIMYQKTHDKNLSNNQRTALEKTINNDISISHEEKIKNYLNNINNQIPKTEINLNIGSDITLSRDAKIYKSTNDAYFNENAYSPYFKNNKEIRTILGVSIEKEGKLINIFANMDNANAKIDNLINNGGTIVNILVGNIEQTPSLKKYQGEKLTIKEINLNAEGWYNINSIKEIQTKGVGRIKWRQ